MDAPFLRNARSILPEFAVVIAGYYWNGSGKPCYYGAVYEWLDENHSCEGVVGLRAVSDVEFEHDGEAVIWGIGR